MGKGEVDMPARTSLPATIGYRLGRGVKVAETLARQEIAVVSPFKVGAVVAGVWGGIAAITNIYRYRKDRVSKQRAVAATASETVGVGLAASLGLVAGNAARMAVVSASTASLLSIAVGTIVTGGIKQLWDRAAGKLIDRYDTPSG
jgi:hypothetical protein